MSETVIRVEGLGKRYRIGALQRPHTRGQELLRLVRTPFSYLARTLRTPHEEEILWALRNVSFEIRRGEVVGIIGRNGAGKSTLLKILSRITDPTEGRAELHGRVGSLLEVGTGFHPELTGRENIYLNGAILGMRKLEIARKFDEIVSFAEVEKFIDTPVKHYSSGMYVRLAFAVAAHLETEILLVDEVLAVGDAAFQKKCLGKMEEAGNQGRTILFVSHNMQAVRNLCSRALQLEAGTVLATGPATTVCDQYLRGSAPLERVEPVADLLRLLPPDPIFRWEGITLRQNGAPVEDAVLNGDPLEIVVNYQVLQPTTGLRVFFDLCDTEDNLLFRSFHDEQQSGIPRLEPGRYCSRAVIPDNLLSPTTYELRLYAGVFNVRHCIPEDGIRFRLNVQRTGKGNRAYVADPIRGKLAPAIPWINTRLCP